MDVQTLAPAAAQYSPGDPSGGFAQSDGSAQGGAGAVLSVAPLSIPQGPPDDSNAGANGKAASTFHLPQEVAKVFTGGSQSHVTVSFQVVHDPNEIVTVFKNTDTGEVITEVPSEIMIKMAEFFDQVAGVVLDKTA